MSFRAWSLLGALLVLGCSGKDAATENARASAPQKVVLGAGLQALAEAHRLADAASNGSERDAAIAAFDLALTALAGPSLLSSEQVWVRQDALARVAQLELDAGRPARAVARCEQGVALGNVSSVPLASLQTIRGRGLEALGDVKAAVDAYHAALVINQELMERALGSVPNAH